MSKLHAILIAVLIGITTSAVAAAQPDYGRGPGYGHHHRAWVPLSRRTAASGSRQLVPLGDASASALRLDVQSGRVYVHQIAVRLSSGQTIVRPIDRWIAAGDPSATVALGGRRNVDRVVVYTSRGGYASYQILGT